MRSRSALTLLVIFGAAAAHAEMTERARHLMGTVCEIAIESSRDPEAEIEAAFDEAARIEAMLSTWNEASELSRLNGDSSHPISVELRDLLQKVSRWSATTGGAFDPRIGRLIHAWNVRGNGATPSSEVLLAATADRSLWEEGAFGKGYALDRMLAIIDAPAAMINFGGQIAVRGSIVATIADPRRRDHAVMALEIENASLSTTSGSEKTFESEGHRFAHILDPRSGRPLPPRGSVSVVHPSALAADILSTALYVMGPEDGLAWAAANQVAAIFIDEHNDIRPSAAACGLGLELIDRNYTIRKEQICGRQQS
jgi:thiamine biosynthesis lipoprotein